MFFPECFCCIVIHLGWISDVCKLYQQWFVTIFPTAQNSGSPKILRQSTQVF